MSDRKRWLDEPKNVDRLFWALCAICALLLVAEMLSGWLGGHHEVHFGVEEMPFFYGVFGFVVFVFIVLAGTQLRKLIMRDEDYYDE